jgi:glycosyltransferase involved in cell wall biosynthesis
MKILYHNPTCGSGIEQVGYIFLFILKKLGHEIDLYNTQCANVQENIISKVIDNYDAIVLNSAYEINFNRMIQKEKNNVFDISHDGSPLPSFCKQLSLNYIHQYQFFYKNQVANITIPITYPYAFNKNIFNSERPNKFVFVGRWIKEKFHPEVKEAMIKNGIKIDKVFTNHQNKEYIPEKVSKEVVINANIKEISDYLSKTKYLLLPSTTECISIVVGEALVNGCLPVVLETPFKEHAQFFNCVIAKSPQEFSEIVKVLNKKDEDPAGVNRENIFNFSNKMWSLDKSVEEFRTIFGTGPKGSITVKQNDHKNISAILPYINATIITGETL